MKVDPLDRMKSGSTLLVEFSQNGWIRSYFELRFGENSTMKVDPLGRMKSGSTLLVEFSQNSKFLKSEDFSANHF